MALLSTNECVPFSFVFFPSFSGVSFPKGSLAKSQRYNCTTGSSSLSRASRQGTASMCASPISECRVLAGRTCPSLAMSQNLIPQCSSNLRWAKSPIASVHRTQPSLADHSAVPRGTNTTSICTPTARFESQRNERRGYEDQNLCFGGDMSPNER